MEQKVANSIMRLRKNPICDLANYSHFYVHPYNCNTPSWGPKPRECLCRGCAIVQDSEGLVTRHL